VVFDERRDAMLASPTDIRNGHFQLPLIPPSYHAKKRLLKAAAIKDSDFSKWCCNNCRCARKNQIGAGTPILIEWETPSRFSKP